MEVLNCTVRMTPATAPYTACEIWAPTQWPAGVQTTASTVTGLAKSAITVYPMFMGGGLGRKFGQDYIAQAITTAMAVGRPVKLNRDEGPRLRLSPARSAHADDAIGKVCRDDQRPSRPRSR